MVIDFGNEARFLFSCEAHPKGLDVLRFSGSEGIGRPFEFQVTLVSKRSDISFDEMVNKRAALMIRGREQDRHVKGIVSNFELMRIHGRHTIYMARLVPPHARLGLRRSMRIFQGKTTRQIVEQVLKDSDITVLEWKLDADYKPRDYCVQYRETDLDFVSRLLEEEGIAYHFEHTDSELRTVFCDAAKGREAIGGTPQVIYKEDLSMVTDQEAVHDFTFIQQLRSGVVELRDYDFKKPLSRVGGTAFGEEINLEIYDYPGEFVDSQLGGRLAQVRLQELEMERLTASGASDCTRLVPGYTFTLGGKVRRHPRPELNQEYLLTIVRHEGDQPLVLGEEGDGGGTHYHNNFSVIPAKVEYRPPRIARRPRVLGTQTATVVGPKGEEIYTDTYGRVKVQFHWDRDGAGSCWIRVSQSWAGAGFGLIFIPRVGQEVLVRFIDGDPDRPVITGKVYNGQQTVPYKLPAGKSRSTIKTSSSPGGGGSNEIRFEDGAGKEELYVHAQHNYTHVVVNDQTTTIKRDRNERVEFAETVWISNERTAEITEKSTHEADKIFLGSDKKVRLVVGASSIEFTPSKITMKSPKIDLEAEGNFTIIGSPVTFDGAASAPDESPYAASADAILGAARGKGGGKGGFTPADADRLIHKKYGHRLPRGTSKSLAQQKTKFASKKEISKQAMKEIEKFYKSKTLSAAERKALQKQSERVRAFAMPGGDIYLPPGAGSDMITHESMHKYSHDNWINQVQRGNNLNAPGGVKLNEGMTGKLTREALGIRGHALYDPQVEVAKDVEKVVGKDTLEKAYFGGDVGGLKRKFDAKKGRGAWDRFLKKGTI